MRKLAREQKDIAAITANEEADIDRSGVAVVVDWSRPRLASSAGQQRGR
jgi:hypothetical protein